MAYLPFLTVAAVTFSGGEEIGIYTSLFATNSSYDETITLIAVSMAMTGLWCVIAHYLVSHSSFVDHLHKIGDILLPFIMIGIGVISWWKHFSVRLCFFCPNSTAREQAKDPIVKQRLDMLFSRILPCRMLR